MNLMFSKAKSILLISTVGLIALGEFGCIQRGSRMLNDEKYDAGSAALDYFQSNSLTIFDLMNIARKMQTSRPLGAPISMDEFLGQVKAHPKGAQFFSNFTASYDSPSDQRASAAFPRIIMTNENGNLTMTFNSGNLQGNDQIEINQVNPITSERMLFSMQFPLQGGAPMPDLPKNPDNCMHCHNGSRMGPRHLWGRYPNWPGMLGGQDDFLHNVKGTYTRDFQGCPKDTTKKRVADDETLKQYEILQHLRKMATSGAERYRHLDFPKDAPATYPYSSNVKGFISQRPNFRFGGLWHRHHINQLFYILQQQKAYEQYAPMHLYGYFSCSAVVDSKVDQELRDMYQVVAATSQVTSPTAASGYDAPAAAGSADKYADKAASTQAFDVAWMNKALSLVGLSMSDLALNEDSSKQENSYGYSPGSERSTVLATRWILERDIVSKKHYPHNSYNMTPPDECQAIYDIEKLPSLTNFGFKPILKKGADDKIDPSMCNAIVRVLKMRPSQMQNVPAQQVPGQSQGVK